MTFHDRCNRARTTRRVQGWPGLLAPGARLCVRHNRAVMAGAISRDWYRGTLCVPRSDVTPQLIIELRQAVHDLHGFQADGDDASEENQRVAGIAPGLGRIIIGVIDDAAGLVGLHHLSLHHPLEGGFAVDDAVIGLRRNVLHGDALIVDRRDFVLLAGPAAELHLRDPVERDRIGPRLGD